MARLKVSVDLLLHEIFGRHGEIVYLDDAVFDPTDRSLVIDIHGPNIPQCEEVNCEITKHREITFKFYDNAPEPVVGEEQSTDQQAGDPDLDIPEADEEWFKKAQLRVPDKE